MTDFFISYTQADRAWAEWIAWVLEAARQTTKIQAWDFGPGRNFVVEMDTAAREAERTLLVLSPDYLASRFGKAEWAAAFAKDPTGEKGTILPVRVREVEVDGLLGPIVYVDLVGLEEAAARERLLAGLARGRSKPVEPPIFPGGRRPRFPASISPGASWSVTPKRPPASPPPIWKPCAEAASCSIPLSRASSPGSRRRAMKPTSAVPLPSRD